MTNFPQKSKSGSKKKKFRFPLEGHLYDQLTVANFVDLESHTLGFYLKRSWNSEFFSKFCSQDLPTKVSLGCKLVSLADSKIRFEPVGKFSVSTKIVDLGGGEKRTKGALWMKGMANTEGRSSYGFEIDRLVALGNMHDTRFYGNVDIRKTNTCLQWRTRSSFGLDQQIPIFGNFVGFRLGMTPDGEFVSQLKL
eukprot:jgi/Galph1/6029/GphlegSOOS_G4715.1